MITLQQQIVVERKFLNYVRKTIIGARLDYFRSKVKFSQEVLTDFTEVDCESVPCKGVEDMCFNTFSLNTFFLHSSKLQQEFEVMSERQKIILELTVIYGFTEKEVAKRFNISQQRVHAIKSTLLQRLREVLEFED